MSSGFSLAPAVFEVRQKEPRLRSLTSLVAFEDAAPRPATPRYPVAWWALVLICLVIAILGWKLFWFLTDDAFITFRYAQNHLRGWGYTWNPPPFRPVEGYTSFFWMLILEAVWATFGILPPESANYISLALALATLGIAIYMGRRMRLTGAAESVRFPLLALVLFATVTNRTFLAWTSSGLETALFNFLLMAWVAVMLYRPFGSRYWIVLVVTLASLLHLTRPDGLLYYFASLLAVALALKAAHARLSDLLAAAPGLIVPAHFLWRHAYYGAWFANTYYAKHVAPWPESGVRYLFSFTIEYSFWIWLALAAVFLWRFIWRGIFMPLAIPLLATIGATLGHFLYYTFIIGGDHFEYRVYSHLVLLLFLSSVWLLDRVVASARAAVAIMALSVLLSYPIPWTHWYSTHSLNTRAETFALIKPVAQAFPALLRPYVRIFDDLQAWLVMHGNNRHQEHKVFWLDQQRRLPTRAEGERIAWEPDEPILSEGCVGLMGWVLPNVAIIDSAGLNDFVVARTPVHRTGAQRIMAHDRSPPPGYIRCFAPNVIRYPEGELVKIRVVPRTKLPDIAACEAQWWRWARSQ